MDTDVDFCILGPLVAGLTGGLGKGLNESLSIGLRIVLVANNSWPTEQVLGHL